MQMNPGSWSMTNRPARTRWVWAEVPTREVSERVVLPLTDGRTMTGWRSRRLPIEGAGTAVVAEGTFRLFLQRGSAIAEHARRMRGMQ